MRLAVILLLLGLLAPVVLSTHFRYGYCSWANNINGNLRTVEVFCRTAWRYSASDPNRACGAAGIGNVYGSANECPCVNMDWVGTLYGNIFTDGPLYCDDCSKDTTNKFPSGVQCITNPSPWAQVPPNNRPDPADGSEYTEFTQTIRHTYAANDAGQSDCRTIGFYAGARLSALENGADKNFLIHSSINLGEISESPVVLSGDPLVKTLPISSTAQYRIRLAPFTGGTGYRCHHDPIQELGTGSANVPRANIGGNEPVVQGDCLIKWDTSKGTKGKRYVVRVHAHQEPNYNYDGDPNTKQVACEVAVGYDFIFTLTDVNSDIGCTKASESFTYAATPKVAGCPTDTCCTLDGTCCSNTVVADRNCGPSEVSFTLKNKFGTEPARDVVVAISHVNGPSVGTFTLNPSSGVLAHGATQKVVYTPPVDNEDSVAGETFTGRITVEDVIYGLQGTCTWSFTVPLLQTGEPKMGVFARHDATEPYTSVLNGDETPTEGEGTDIGSVRISRNPLNAHAYDLKTFEFVIANIGQAPLHVTTLDIEEWTSSITSCGNSQCHGVDWHIDVNDVGKCLGSATAAKGVSPGTATPAAPVVPPSTAERITSVTIDADGDGAADPCIIPGASTCAVGTAFPTDEASVCNTFRVKIQAQAYNFGLRGVFLNVGSTDGAGAALGDYKFVANLVGVDPEIAVQDFNLLNDIPEVAAGDFATVSYDMERLNDAKTPQVFHVGHEYPVTLHVVNEYRAQTLTLIPPTGGNFPAGTETVYDRQNNDVIHADAEIKDVLAYPTKLVNVHIGAHAVPLTFTYAPTVAGAKVFAWSVHSDDTIREVDRALAPCGGAGVASEPECVEGFLYNDPLTTVATDNGFNFNIKATPINPLRELFPPGPNPPNPPGGDTKVGCEAMPTFAAGTRFKGVLRDSAPVEQTFRLANAGTTDLTITSIKLSGDSAFSLKTGQPTTGTVAATAPGTPPFGTPPYNAMDVAVVVSTATAGLFTTNLTIADNTFEGGCTYFLEAFVGFFDVTSPIATTICYMYFPCQIEWSTNIDARHEVTYKMHTTATDIGSTPNPKQVWKGATGTGTGKAIFRNSRVFPRQYTIKSEITAFTGPGTVDSFVGAVPKDTPEFGVFSSVECHKKSC